MAKSIAAKNDKPARKTKNQKTNFLKVFYYIGKPFYSFLSATVVAILFFFYIVGHLFYSSFNLAFKKLKIKIKKPTLPKIKIKIKKEEVFIPKEKRVIKIHKIKPLKAFLLFLILTFGFLVFSFFKSLPSPKKLTERKIEVSTKIYDRNGILLYTIYKDKNRTPIRLTELPEFVKYATLAAEDAEFYQHPGFSIRGILRAIIRNYTRGELTGGSTITQQLVKNALLTPEKTLTRKIKELVLAVMVELNFSKDEILEMYLNEVSYGGTAYGIEEASKTYFGKSAKELNLSEAAFLAGLPKSPSKFSPYSGSPELGIARQKDVLNLMRINGFITEEDEKKALAQEINFSIKKTDIKAPHFVMYAREQLENMFSKEVVETGGLEVITTLDYSIQKRAEKAIEDQLKKIERLNVKNAAAVVLDPKTGEILAMVGSKDYFDTKNDGNVNVATSLRQPGSSIKVVNYAYALSNGYTPATIISDTPIIYKIKGQPDYTPKNYDGKYRGNLSLRSALAESRNIPAVRVLASYGVDKMIEMGKKMGITTWEDKDRFGLSLTLGGGEVKLLELAQVYSVLANYGQKPTIKSILSVKNYKGKILYEDKCRLNQENCQNTQVLDPRVAFILTNILSDNGARAPAFGRNSSLVIPKHPEVAAKTGTSNNLRDNLTVGYNQDYVVAVWVGNNDSSPMSRIASGITGAAPIFNQIMASLLVNKESIAWQPPKGLVSLAICPLTATLPCNGCPIKKEWFLEENAPKKSCSSDFVQKLKEPRTEPQILEPAASVEVILN